MKSQEIKNNLLTDRLELRKKLEVKHFVRFLKESGYYLNKTVRRFSSANSLANFSIYSYYFGYNNSRELYKKVMDAYVVECVKGEKATKETKSLYFDDWERIDAYEKIRKQMSFYHELGSTATKVGASTSAQVDAEDELTAYLSNQIATEIHLSTLNYLRNYNGNLNNRTYVNRFTHTTNNVAIRRR